MGAQVKSRLDSLGGAGGFASGAAVGGVLGLLLGGKKVRKATGGLLGYGGAAAVGALAMHAYQAYKRGQSVQGTVPMSVDCRLRTCPPAALPHAKPAADGGAFELVLVKAMVGAAKADGHIDAQEQRRLFSEVERMGLDSEAKAYVFDLLTKPTGPREHRRAVWPRKSRALSCISRRASPSIRMSRRSALISTHSRLVCACLRSCVRTWTSRLLLPQ